jgi:hypothetical protein
VEDIICEHSRAINGDRNIPRGEEEEEVVANAVATSVTIRKHRNHRSLLHGKLYSPNPIIAFEGSRGWLSILGRRVVERAGKHEGGLCRLEGSFPRY